MNIIGSFRGFEYRPGVSRLFKVYITEQGIYGAWIADRDYEYSLQYAQDSGANKMILSSLQGVERRAQQLEAGYDAGDFNPETFRKQHKHNFVLGPGSVSRILIEYDAKMAKYWWNRRAKLTLEGPRVKHRFYIVGGADIKQVALWLERMAPVTVIGEASFEAEFAPNDDLTDLPEEDEEGLTPMPVRESQAKRYGWGAAIVLGLGIGLWMSYIAESWIGMLMFVIAFKTQGVFQDLYMWLGDVRDWMILRKRNGTANKGQ